MPTTVATLEHLATPQPNMVAGMAGLACISRRYGNNLNTRLDALVLKVLPQLIERPTVRASSFGFAARLLIGSLSDARQVLNRNDGAEFLRLRDDLTADVMVEPGLKSPLSPRQPLQDLPRPVASRSCALRGFPLKRCPHPGIAVTHLIDLLPVPSLVGRGAGNLAPTKVYSDNPIGFDGFRSVIG